MSLSLVLRNVSRGQVVCKFCCTVYIQRSQKGSRRTSRLFPGQGSVNGNLSSAVHALADVTAPLPTRGTAGVDVGGEGAVTDQRVACRWAAALLMV